MGERWRTGRKVGRTIYAHADDDEDGRLIGTMDTPGLAAEAVSAVNKIRNVADGFEQWPWPQPTRFDPDDRSTWPENAPHRVLVSTAGQPWYTAMLMDGMWVEDFSHAGDPAKAGDLWLLLPPTVDGQTRENRKTET